MSSDSHDCNECPLIGAQTSRLDFIKQIGTMMAGAGLLLGGSAHDASALAVRFGRALLVHGDEVTYDIPASDGATIDKDNQVILVRDGNQVYAFSLSCPHQNTALRWLPDDHIFQCPKHKSKYKPNGTFISGRATRGMDRLAIRKQDNHIIVNPNTVYEQNKNGKEWDAAVVTLDAKTNAKTDKTDAKSGARS